MSIVFDRAVEYYDKTRALPEDRQKASVGALVHETGLKPDSRVLEVGIGTGRIGLGVAEHVKRLYGIDLSLEMMGVLRRKLGNTNLQIELAQADAGRLPFGDETFDAAYAVHVYHLVQGWREALMDAHRVLKTGGKFAVSFHVRIPDSPNARLRRELNRMVKEHGIDTRRPGVQSEEDLYDLIKTWDPHLYVATVGEWTDNEVPAEMLDDLDKQIFSETWLIPRDVMDKVMPPLRAWAKHAFGDLNKPIPVTYDIRWLVATKR